LSSKGGDYSIKGRGPSGIKRFFEGSSSFLYRNRLINFLKMMELFSKKLKYSIYQSFKKATRMPNSTNFSFYKSDFIIREKECVKNE